MVVAPDSPRGPRRRGLTYGRLLTILTMAILVAVGAGLFQNWRLGAYSTFDEVPFALIAQAPFDVAELTRAELAQLDRATPRIPGALVFVRTSDGRLGKLAIGFGHRFFAPQPYFVVYRGTIYNPDGTLHREILARTYVPLTKVFDLDSGEALDPLPGNPAIDLAFETRGTAEQTVKALTGAAFALPPPEALKRR